MKTVLDLIKNQDVAVISKSNTVLDAARLMTEKKIGAVPVVEGDRVVGIFSERDIMNRVVARNLNPEKTKIEDVMTTDLIIGNSSESLDQIESRMKQSNIRHLPIVDGSKLVGIISLRDLLDAELDEKVEEIKIMTAYIHYIPPSFEN